MRSSDASTLRVSDAPARRSCLSDGGPQRARGDLRGTRPLRPGVIGDRRPHLVDLTAVFGRDEKRPPSGAVGPTGKPLAGPSAV